MSDNHKNTLKTAWNDVTGDTIVSGKGGNEKYASGWDAIFGKKVEATEPDEETLHMFSKIHQADCWTVENALEDYKDVPLQKQTMSDKACGCLKSCGGTREEYDENCYGWNSCSYCDNGWFACNQYCVVFG